MPTHGERRHKIRALHEMWLRVGVQERPRGVGMPHQQMVSFKIKRFLTLKTFLIYSIKLLLA